MKFARLATVDDPNCDPHEGTGNLTVLKTNLRSKGLDSDLSAYRYVGGIDRRPNHDATGWEYDTEDDYHRRYFYQKFGKDILKVIKPCTKCFCGHNIWNNRVLQHKEKGYLVIVGANCLENIGIVMKRACDKCGKVMSLKKNTTCFDCVHKCKSDHCDTVTSRKSGYCRVCIKSRCRDCLKIVKDTKYLRCFGCHMKVYKEKNESIVE